MDSGLGPESENWLRLVELAAGAVEDPGWAAVEPRPDGARPAEAPLLHGATVQLDARVARRWVRRLLKTAAQGRGAAAASLRQLRARRLDPAELLTAAVAQDEERVQALAAEAGADRHALAAVAQVTAMPLLQACARRLADQVPVGWRHGYCPVCGAWPSLAEHRGLKGERHLRCGRCGCDWELIRLLCAFCGEKDHRKLGSLVPEDDRSNRRADVCKSCKGYLKTTTTLQPVGSWNVVLEDFKSIDLDIAALERGFSRPARPGHETVPRLALSGGRLFGRRA